MTFPYLITFTWDCMTHVKTKSERIDSLYINYILSLAIAQAITLYKSQIK